MHTCNPSIRQSRADTEYKVILSDTVSQGQPELHAALPTPQGVCGAPLMQMLGLGSPYSLSHFIYSVHRRVGKNFT